MQENTNYLFCAGKFKILKIDFTTFGPFPEARLKKTANKIPFEI